MQLVVYDKETNRYMTSKLYQEFNALKQARIKEKPWEVIDLCVKLFKKRYPNRYKSYVIRLENLREAEKVTNVGSKRFRGVSKDKVHDTYVAHTVDFPVWIMNLIRKLYNTEELIMDKDFFREFGKRHPEFRILESV